MNKKPFTPDQMGIGYMLAGDTGSSNIDPCAEVPTGTNQWVVEGPHAMVIVRDPAQLEGLPTDPHNGSAYVMWKGTPYVHIMCLLARAPEPNSAPSGREELCRPSVASSALCDY